MSSFAYRVTLVVVIFTAALVHLAVDYGQSKRLKACQEQTK